MRILLGDQTGRVQAEVDKGSISNVVWRLNQSGTATLRVKRDSSAFRRDLLEPGARIYVEHENGLPAWGGVLDLPRGWMPGYLETRAYTIERLLKFRITAKTRSFYGDVVGSIWTQILREAEQRAALGLRIGQIWLGGAAHYPRYHLRDAAWVTDQSVRKMETCDYRIVPYLANNQILFRCELHEQLGDDRRDQVALIEGANVSEAKLTEQGDIVNRVAVVGSGATWGERPVVWGIEEFSRRRYGLREAALTPQDVSQTATLNRYADNEIRERAYPHKIATLQVADRNPSYFRDYDVGDTVQVILPSFDFDGYDAPMRITARGYDPVSGVCELVCDERFEYDPVFLGEDDTQPGGDD